jgi:hypothetical protein
MDDDNKMNVDAEEIEHSENWHICCSNSSAQGIKYISTVSILLVIITVSLCNLTFAPDTNRDVYLNLLSLCVGILIPHPKGPVHEVKEKTTIVRSPTSRYRRVKRNNGLPSINSSENISLTV